MVSLIVGLLLRAVLPTVGVGARGRGTLCFPALPLPFSRGSGGGRLVMAGGTSQDLSTALLSSFISDSTDPAPLRCLLKGVGMARGEEEHLQRSADDSTEGTKGLASTFCVGFCAPWGSLV